jgi:hypothetical protein
MSEQQFPVRQFGRTTGLEQRSVVSGRWSVRRPPSHRQIPRHTCPEHTRPETHQNLIHSNKEQRHPTGRHNRHDHTTRDALPRHMIKPNSGHSAIRTNGSFEASPRGHGGFIVCEANDRGGDNRDRTDDPLLAKQVLSQLSYAPNLWNPPHSEQDHPIHPPASNTTSSPNALKQMGAVLVGQGGFEPPTPRLSSVCSNQLSY